MNSAFALMQEGRPINSQDTRAEWLARELESRRSWPTAHLVSLKDMVGWYMKCGYSLGLPRETLENALTQSPDALELAHGLDDAEIEAGKPPPEFSQGQLVEVIVNARNLTYHRGEVREVGWHHKEQQWLYLLVENGKKVSKRYEARDLKATEG